MSFKNVVGKFRKKVYDKIYNNKEFVEESKMKKEDFTRNRKVRMIWMFVENIKNREPKIQLTNFDSGVKI